MTRLISFDPGAKLSTAFRITMSVGADPDICDTRPSVELVSSNPQYQVSRPWMMSTAPVPAPSRIARSPGNWRTTIGAAAVPMSRAVNGPLYVPPCNQMVAPGFTAAGWANPVVRSHGFMIVPSPCGPPVGETWNPGPGGVHAPTALSAAGASAFAGAVSIPRT